jgi:hypothetical protein
MIYSKRLLLISLRLIIGLTFTIAAIFKMVSFEFFSYSLVDTGLFSWSSAMFISPFIIGFELLCGCCVLFKLIPYFSLSMVIMQSGVYLFYSIFNGIRSGFKSACNCFGTEIYNSFGDMIFVNIALIGLSVVLFFAYAKEKKSKSHYVFSVVVILFS